MKGGLDCNYDYGSIRKNLLIVRAGPKSLHAGWCKQQPRNWDLLVSAYADGVDRSDAEFHHHEVGPKWGPLYNVINENWKLISRYQYVCLSDDDLEANADDWSRAFLICEQLRLVLAQPSLSRDSYFSHEITLAREDRAIRYTNFVEQMCPIFSREALLRCLPSMNTDDRFAWGLDFVWPHLLGHPVGRMAIIDDVQVRHTRPAGHDTDFAQVRKSCLDLLHTYDLVVPTFTVHGHLERGALSRSPWLE